MLKETKEEIYNLFFRFLNKLRKQKKILKLVFAAHNNSLYKIGYLN